jgi:hypothetical protein
VLVHVFRQDLTKAGKAHWYGGGDLNLLIRPDENAPESDRFAVYADITPGVDLDRDQLEVGSYTIGLSRDNRQGTLVLETVKFSAPSPVSPSTFMWPGRDVAISDLRLVKLPPNGKFPGEGETLKCIVSPQIVESFLRGSSSGFGGFPEILAQFKAEGEGTQNWPIEIPEETVGIAQTILATEQFPNLPAGLVAQAARKFFEMDKDGNQEVSQEEYPATNRGSLAEKLKHDPVTFPAFIEAYVEFYQSRSSSRSRGGP